MVDISLLVCYNYIIPTNPKPLNEGEKMIAYGKVKTRHPGKDGTHRNCSICNPATGNKKKARQEGKKEAKQPEEI